MHLKGAYWHNMLAHTPDYDTTHTLSVSFKHTITYTHTHSLLLCVWVWARALCQVSAQCGTPLHVSTRWTHLCLLHTHTVTTPWTNGLQHKDTNIHILSFSHRWHWKDLYIHSYTNIRCQSVADGGRYPPPQKNYLIVSSCVLFCTIHFNY